MDTLLRKVIAFLTTTNLPIPGKDRLVSMVREIYEARQKAIAAVQAYRRIKGAHHPAVNTLLDAESELQDLLNLRGVEGLGVPWAPIAAAGGIAAVAVALSVGAWKLSSIKEKYYQVVQNILDDPNLSTGEKQAILRAIQQSSGLRLGISIPLWVPLAGAVVAWTLMKRR